MALEASNYDKLMEMIGIETSRFGVKILGRLISKNRRFWRKAQVTWLSGLGCKSFVMIQVLISSTKGLLSAIARAQMRENNFRRGFRNLRRHFFSAPNHVFCKGVGRAFFVFFLRPLDELD